MEGPASMAPAAQRPLPPNDTAAHAAVEVLAAAGIRRCYTVPGESFLELADAIDHHPEMTLVSTRHEGGAAFMAEADAKLTGVPAVAAATRGPGAANLAVGVHTAMQDSTPMIVFLGQAETERLGREAFQEVDLTAFYAPITKWSTTVHRADRLPEITARAIRIATTGRPGPVAIAVPGDLFGQRLGERPVPEPFTAPRPSLGTADRDRLASWLTRAVRPVIIAGGGARAAREELVRVAERYSAGVYAAWRRQDVFPNDHPLYLGHLGLGAPSAVLGALADADAVLVVGCRMSETTTQGYLLPESDGRTRVAQIDVDPQQVGATCPVWLGAVADAGKALSDLARAPGQTPYRDWSAARRLWVESSTPPREITEHQGERMHPWSVVAGMRQALPEDTLLTNDAGNFASFLHRGWWFRHPRTQLAPTSGAMGYAVPAAVAAKIADPERTVVAVAGDGGALMTGQELETAVRMRAAVTVVVFQNGLYGTIAMHQARELGRLAGTRISGPLDLAGYARALGARGATVHTREELEKALAESITAELPTLVDVRTDPEVISPTTTMSDLLGSG